MDKRDIAGLFMTHYSDRPGDDARAQFERVRTEVTELGVGGYCIFGGGLRRIRDLNARLANEVGGRLLVASDLEQGLGQQVEGGTVFPSQMAIGAAGSPELAAGIGRAVGSEASAVGIDIVFAPVADLATEPSNPIVGVRSYGADPHRAAACVSAYVSGCQSSGTAATVKHFPGHGDTVVDSHIDLPVVPATARALDERELVPFRAAIASDVRLIMMGHLALPKLAGAGAPASLAPSIGHDLLRGKLGYEGVVVTDALNMGAVARRHGSGEAAVLALLAGADLLLMPEDLTEALEGLTAAVDSGRVSEERLRASLNRVGRLLDWSSAFKRGPRDLSSETGAPRAPVDEVLSEGLLSEHEALALAAAREAVTIVRGEQDLPGDAGLISREDALFVAAIDSERPPDLEFLRTEMARRRPEPELHVLTESSSEADLDLIFARAGDASFLGAFVFDAPAAWRGRLGPPEAVTSALGRAARDCARSTALVFGGPSVLPSFEEYDILMCAYDGSAYMQRAGLEVLFGERPARGHLPAPVVRTT